MKILVVLVSVFVADSIEGMLYEKQNIHMKQKNTHTHTSKFSSIYISKIVILYHYVVAKQKCDFWNIYCY